MAGESLRDYFIRFLFKTDKSGADQVQKALEGIEKKLHSAGAEAFDFNERLEKFKTTVIEPLRRFKEMIEHTAEEADNLRDLSDRTGIATDRLEKLGYMAKLAGSSQESLTTGMRILEKNMGEAAQGGKEQAETFAKLGVNIHGANGKLKTTEELLPELSKGFEKLPDHATKTAYAMKLFGRAGQELIPLLERGPDELASMQRELELLGGVTSEKFLDASEHYVDNLDKMNQVWKGIRQAIAGPFLRMFNQSNDALLRWWKVWGELIRSKITEWVQQLVTSWQAFQSTIKQVLGPLLLLAAALNVPLLVMIGLKALLALLIDDFANWMAGNDSLIGRMIANWQDWLTELAKTHPTLAAMMGAFGSFVDAASQGIHAIFLLFDTLITSFLEGGWAGFTKELGDTFASVGEVIKGIWLSMIDFLAQEFAPILRIIDGVKEALGFDASITTTGSAGKRAAERVNGPSGTPGVVGASGLAGSSNTRVDAPVEINVQGTPGMDTKDLAEKIGDVFEERMSSMVRQSFNTVVPESY